MAQATDTTLNQNVNTFSKIHTADGFSTDVREFVLKGGLPMYEVNPEIAAAAGVRGPALNGLEVVGSPPGGNQRG